MGYRLSKITTRTGDGGETGLGDGSRVPKDDARIEALGAVDELNSQLGLLLAQPLAEDVRACIRGVQNDLFDVGGELSIPGHTLLREACVDTLEERLEHYNRMLPPLKEFILPGGTAAAAHAHVARAVCRRAERAVVGLRRNAAVSPLLLRYLNRLSDLLFVLARALNRSAGEADVLWSRSPPAPDSADG